MVRKENRAKFDPGRNLYYLGYTEGGYRLWNPDTKNIIRCRDVKFDEICSKDLVLEIPPTSDLPSDEISNDDPADEIRVDGSSTDATAVEELDSNYEENFQSLDMNTTQQRGSSLRERNSESRIYRRPELGKISKVQRPLGQRLREREGVFNRAINSLVDNPPK